MHTGMPHTGLTRHPWFAKAAQRIKSTAAIDGTVASCARVDTRRFER
ncbi:MAG: hypothetical protein R3F42_14225 [Pseudomonadota bacterium]